MADADVAITPAPAESTSLADNSYVTTTRAMHYEEVKLDSFSSPFVHNSILMVPDMLTSEECASLMQTVDSHLEAGGAWRGQDEAYLPGTEADKEAALKRVWISDLEEDTQEFTASIITDRVLPIFEQQLPDVAIELFGRSSDLAEMEFTFSPGEPAINRYTKGGEFKRHRDRFSLTVYVTLSEESAYVGGGTAFWAQDPESEDSDEHTAVVRASQGGAVIFNGDVQHSGLPVESGIRHLFVASFHLEDPNAPPVPHQWSRCRKGEREMATE